MRDYVLCGTGAFYKWEIWEGGGTKLWIERGRGRRRVCTCMHEKCREHFPKEGGQTMVCGGNNARSAQSQ